MRPCLPLLALAGLLTLCSLTARAESLTIGSKRFTESYVLGEILRATAQSAGADATHRQGLGNTAIVLAALEAGSIDLYVDYSGTLALEVLGLPAVPPLPELSRAFAARGLAVGVPLGFENGYALAMRGDVARRLGIATVGDLARQPALRLGLSQEFLGRRDGWPALKAGYALPQPTPRGLDHGLAYDALAAATLDVTDVYTTDARIAADQLALLADDHGVLPRYDAVLVWRADLPARAPVAFATLAQLQGRIDAPAMRGMNARAEAGVPFAQIARDFLAGRAADATGPTAPQPAPRASAWSRLPALLGGDDFTRLAGQHLYLVLASVAAALAVGVPLGIVAARRPRLGAALLGGVGLLQTLPSLALLAALVALTGSIGLLPAFVALALYALLPIVRNTYTGLAGIAAGQRLAGLALGLTPAQVLRHVELPLAWPVILAGARTAAVTSVGTATIAAFVGAGGFGERIVTGLALGDGALMLAGALPAAGLALLVDGLGALAGRLSSPARSARGDRRAAAPAASETSAPPRQSAGR
ncbi:glycine betaine ABC transporter substrate-binding protein [Derxia lacustris]|uniref:glycine betaine ABC transporter substrate-binding protein n=1 Tax=Derxia lacustris TaxID=764842 RepID=UPI000A16F2D0|nr:glycine betaine ABC transporter substrate-binding protein [Derxia lacustris]